MVNSRLTEIRNIRLDRLSKLRSLGINPFPTNFSLPRTDISQALMSLDKEVSVVGRIWKLRGHGNAIFMDLRDESATIQLLFQKKTLEDKFSVLKLLDIGDFLGVKGKVIKTQAGETTVDVNYFEVLGKALRPMPDDWTGLKDTEERYRKRYLDLLLDPEIKNKFVIRSKVLSETRKYLESQGFVEVETPVFHPLYGGANAKPFKSHMNALDTDFYLRIAFELYLKRLVVGGYEKVYEIGRDFRNEGIDHSHSPEFTMLEWYESYTDYHGIMDRTEGLIKHLANKIYGKAEMLVDDKKIDIGKKWPRVCMTDLLSKRLNLDVEKLPLNALTDYCAKNKIDLVKGESKGQIIFDIFDKQISKTLIEPIFVIDYPQEVSPLSKPHRSKPGWVERFEGYVGGREICDGWSELTDPLVQRERFEADTKAARSDKEEAQVVDEDFLEAMEYGMPPIGGIGIGMDRLTMFFTNTWSLKEVILFPTLRPDNETIKTKTKVNSGDYAISPEVKQKFPGVAFAYTIIKGVKIKKSNDELEQLKKQALESRKGLTLEEVSEIAPISIYRKMLKSTGVDTGSRRPSPEALIRRIVQGKSLYNINTAVDAYNLAVIETAIGLGGFDFAQIAEPVVLRLAKAGEEMHLLGDEENTKTKEGELVYADADKLLTLDLNYRDIDATKITEKTKDIILFADGGPGIDQESIKSALQKGADYIIQFCGGKLSEIKLIQ